MRQAAFRKEENLDLESLAYPSADKQFLQSIIDMYCSALYTGIIMDILGVIYLSYFA